MAQEIVNVGTVEIEYPTINATPHPITIDGVTVAPSNITVRAMQDNTITGYRIITGDDGKRHRVPIVAAVFGEITIDGIPDAEFIVRRAMADMGQFCTIIVSLIAYNAMKAQGMPMNNVFIPTGQIRDESGKVVGSLGIGKPA